MSSTENPEVQYHTQMAKLAEQTERFDDMVEHIKQVIELRNKNDQMLKTDERNLLSVAYKNIVGARRSSWRVLNAIDGKDSKGVMDHKDKGNAVKHNACKELKKKLENELDSICGNVIELLEKILEIGSYKDDKEAYVFFLKMKGDYFRYMAEYCDEANKQAVKDKSELAYKQAYDIAESDMTPTHPNRLGLALNFSVFYYEIQNQPEKACSLAKKAFDDAIAELDNLDSDSYKDSTLIMQLLRDNLTLWTSDEQESEEQQENQ